jgi:hypothetical protein
MTQEVQAILRAGIPTLAVVIGIFVDGRLNGIHGRIEDLRSHLDRRLDDLKGTCISDLRRVQERLR